MRLRSFAGVVACFGLGTSAWAQTPTQPDAPKPVRFFDPHAGATVEKSSTVVRGQQPESIVQPKMATPLSVNPGTTVYTPNDMMAQPAPTTYGSPTFSQAAPQSMPIAQPTVATPNYGVSDAGYPYDNTGNIWIRGEYLGWVAKGQNIPSLATVAPVGTPRATAGAIGSPLTQTVIGGRRVNDDYRNGFRLSAGMWLNDARTFGLQGNFFFLGDSNERFAAGSDGSGIVTRPFTNALTGLPDTQLVSFPGVLAGTVTADASSSVIGGGFNFLCNLCCDPCGRTDFLLGYRYINLRDEVVIRENLTALPGSSVPAGSRFLIEDRFRTDNDFHGVPIGLRLQRRFGYWFVDTRASVALGVTHSTTTISGSTTIIDPTTGTAQVFPGGLLTQPTNIGRYTNDEFAVVPEIGVRVGMRLTDNFLVFAGYNYLYWSNVMRAGDQIDTRVNTTQVAPPQPFTGAPFPAFPNRTTDFYLHGFSLGAEVRF